MLNFIKWGFKYLVFQNTIALSSDDDRLYSAGEIAHVLGFKNPLVLLCFLHENGYVYKDVLGRFLPYKNRIPAHCYFIKSHHSGCSFSWTQQGCHWLFNLLQKG